MNLKEELDSTTLETESYMQQAVGLLGQLIAMTEEKYAYVYETLPQSEENISVSIREVGILLNYLIFNREQVGSRENSIIISALNQIQNEFEEVTETFLNKELISVLLKTFLDDTGHDDQSFSELGRLAVEVKDTLEGLRDLALNSIIFSIRAGEKGAGFQVISDRINQISAELSNKFGRMNTAIIDLNDWNKDFQKKLTDFIGYEENLKSKYKNKFQGEFKKVKFVLKATCDFLTDHLINTKTVSDKVPEAMVLIQNQDIIRQNTENLIKCLNIVLQKKHILGEQNREEVLNYLVFANKVGELADSLLNNIEEGLEQSICALEAVLQDISLQAEDLETESKHLGSFFAGAQGEVTRYNVINDVFKTIIGQVVDLLYIKRHIEAKSRLLLEGRETFVRLMETVERDFEAINREIKTLKKMKVLIKIELTRIDSGKDSSMNNIVGAVDQVIDTVNDNQLLFTKLRNYFTNNLDQFNNAVERTKSKIEDSGEALEVSRRKINQAHGLATGAVEAMVEEMGEIFNELKEPYQHMQVMDQVREILDSVRQLIGSYRIMVNKQIEKLFNYYGINQWEQKEEDLRTLLDQFTCYVERKSVDSVFKDVSSGLEEHSNDIVLF